MRNIEKLNIAFQGEHGAYGEMAVLKFFPNSKPIPSKTFYDVFEKLIKNKVDYAVVPIENSIEGSINETYDLLKTYQIHIIGEVFQFVSHCFIINRNCNLRKIKKIYSHPQALAQCRRFWIKRYEAHPTYDTAGAVKIIKELNYYDAGAIASKRAGELYDMEIVKEGIQDNRNNFTRFLVLSKKSNVKRSGNDKTSIIFSINHSPGSLFGILEEFAKRNLNLTKIESRPTKEKLWEYYFFVDFEGHLKEKTVAEMLKVLKCKCNFLKVLGSYQIASKD